MKKNSFILIILLILLIMGCSKAKSDRSAFSRPEMTKELAFDENFGEQQADNDQGPGVVSETGGQAPQEPVKPETSLEGDRKRIKRGNISLVVKELQKAEKQIEELVARYGGYTAGSYYSGSYYQISAKIPADKFDAFLTASEGIGKLQSKNVSVEDVTRQFYDLEGRIKNKRILLERYQSYLQKAVNTDELLKLERAINDTMAEIENMEGSYKDLSHLIKYSTLDITLQPPASETVISRSWPSIKKGFKDLGYAMGLFLYGLLFTVLYIVLFGVPVILILALFYFLALGKVGLLRKLFQLLSQKKPK